MVIETDIANDVMSVRVVTDIMGLGENSLEGLTNIVQAYTAGITEAVNKYMGAHPSNYVHGCSVCSKGPAVLVKNVSMLNHHLRLQVFTTRRDGKPPRLCKQHYTSLLYAPLWYQLQETTGRLVSAIQAAKKGKK